MSSFAFVGPPGTGKSTMAASACKAGYTVHFIDADKKVRGMANLQEYITKGQITFYEVASPLIAETLAERAKKPLSYPQRQPEGYLEMAMLINGYIDNPPPCDIVVLDSFTRLCNHLRRYMMFMSKRPHFEYSDWDAWKSILTEVTDSFLSIPVEHRIIIYHNRIVRDEITGAIKLPVSVDGSYQNEVGSFFEEMYQFEVDVDKAGKASFTCKTKPDRQKDARSSHNVDTIIPSDLSLILPSKL